LRNINAAVTRNVDKIFSEVFEPTTWDCGLDQLVPNRAIF
jgi:hypothetical protein